MEMTDVLSLLQVTMLFQNIGCGDTTNSSDENAGKRRRRVYNRWSSEMDAQLVEIHKNINTSEAHHFPKVKNEWFNLNPYSNITVKALYHRFRQISEKIEGEGKRPRREFKWNDEKYNDLVDTYLHTRPYDGYKSVKISDEWKRRHEDSPNYSDTYLAKRAREWIEKRKLNVQGESSKRLFEWSNRQDSDLLHAYHVTLPEKNRRSMAMYRIFTDLHPDLGDLTNDQITERIKYLQRNPSNEHFPWTKVQNKELLEIYYNTSPEVSDQMQRIYDIWSKIHPRYNFMTPYYLQVHASTLAHHEEMKVGEKKRKTKFTDEQKAFAIDTYRRLTKPNKVLYDFHKAWAWEYPSLAYLPPKTVAWNVRKWIGKDDSSDGKMSVGELQSDLRKYQHREHHFYTPEEKAELMVTYQQTNPHERGHSNRIYEKCLKKQQHVKNVKALSLRRTIKAWMQQDPNVRGKEPMLTPKAEVGSESSSSASSMSQ